jgi:hypothetical protein
MQLGEREVNPRMVFDHRTQAACVDRRYAGKLQHHASARRRTAPHRSPEVCLGSHRQPVVRPDDDDVATNDSFILMQEAYSSCFFI